MDNLVGNTLRGYEFIEEINRGGFGTIFRANQTAINREVAIKIVRPDHLDNDEFKQRFEAEARIVARLEHPYIVPLHEYWHEGENAFLVMRFVRGGTLKSFIRKQERVPIKFALKITDQIASALDYSHRRGVIHRDLKPQNILLDEDNNAYLADFGIAKDLTSRAITTAEGQIFGSPLYISPEQINNETIVPQTDIYAFGLILYEMLTGQHPFDGLVFSDLLIKHIREPIPLLNPEYADIPPDVDNVLQKATAKSISDRYKDVLDVAVDFRRCFEPTQDFDPETISATLDLQELTDIQPGPARKQMTISIITLLGGDELWDELYDEEISDLYDTTWRRIRETVAHYDIQFEQNDHETATIAWGTSSSREDMPEIAIRVALDASEQLDNYFGEQSVKLFPRITVDTGIAILREISQDQWSPSGDVVNSVRRLHQSAYDVGVYISHDTLNHVRGVFSVNPTSMITIPGRSDPVQMYEVLNARPRAFKVVTRGVEGIVTKMVGRVAELERLKDELYIAFEDQRARMVTIVGGAGIGKSRLLYEFNNWWDIVKDVWVMVYKGRATPDSISVPYSVIRDLLFFRFEIKENDPPDVARDKLVEGLITQSASFSEDKAHFIGHLIGLDFTKSQYLEAVLDDVEQVRIRSYFYLAQFLKTVRVPDSTVVGFFIEDLHWADDGSLDLIEYLMEECNDFPLLIVGTARPTLFERRSRWGEGRENWPQIDLKPLSSRETRALVNEVLQKTDQLPDQLRNLIVDQAQGNPFYVEELIKMMIEEGAISTNTEPWQVHLDKLENLHIPTTLIGVLQARLDQLSIPEKIILQRASVVGRIFWDGAIFAMSPGYTTDQANRVLQRLREKELIYHRSNSDLDGMNEYVFKHAILHNVTYETLLLKDRRPLHNIVAEWMMEAGGERTMEQSALIAQHYGSARKNDSASEWFYLAGKQAAQKNVFEQAVDYFHTALDYLDESSNHDAHRLQILEELSDVASGMEKDNAIQQMLALAEKLGDFRALAQALTWQARITRSLEAGLKQLQRAEDLLKTYRHLDDDLFIDILVYKAVSNLELGNVSISNQIMEEAFGLAQTSATMARVNLVQGVLHGNQGQLKQAKSCFEKSKTLYEELEDRGRTLTSLSNLAEVTSMIGDYSQAISLIREAEDIAQDHGYKERRTGQILRLNRNVNYVKMGHYPETIPELRVVLSQISENRDYDAVFECELICYLVIALLELDEANDAMNLTSQAYQTGKDYGSQLGLGHAFRALGHTAYSLNEPLEIEEAIMSGPQCFARSIEHFGNMNSQIHQAHSYRDWAVYEFKAGNHSEGEVLWQKARSLFEQCGATFEVERMKILPE